MGKTRDLFKKFRDTKGIFHAKMGSIKDRNGMDLTEAQNIKMRWQEYTEELYKKDLNDLYNHNHELQKKNVQTTVQLHSFHMPARLCSKSFNLGFSNTCTKNIQIKGWI